MLYYITIYVRIYNMAKENAKEQLHVRLRRMRKDARLTQEEIASALDINRLSVVAMEAGNRRVSADELSQLCRLFHCTADELLFGEKKEKGKSFYRAFEALDTSDKEEVLELMEFKIRRKRKGVAL